MWASNGTSLPAKIEQIGRCVWSIPIGYIKLSLFPLLPSYINNHLALISLSESRINHERLDKCPAGSPNNQHDIVTRKCL
jgi:hypothetical protein